LPAIGTTRTQELQTGLDMGVAGIELGGTLVRIQGVGNLIVTGFVLA
jgi:hypothetical protein